jgi:hypothetical protein
VFRLVYVRSGVGLFKVRFRLVYVRSGVGMFI